MNKEQIIKLAEEKAPIALGGIASLGVILTSVLSAKAGAKISDKAKKRQYEFMNKKEKTEFIFIEGTKAFLPSIISGLVTLGAIAGGIYISERHIDKLTAALAGTDLILKAREKADIEEKKFGEILAEDFSGEDIDILDTGTGDELYFEPYSHQFFLASELFVTQCEYHFNRNFQLRGYATLSEFLEFLGLKTSKFTDSIGWSDISEQVYGYRWVDFVLTSRKLKSGKPYISIDYPFAPHYDYLDPFEGTPTGLHEAYKKS